MPATLRQALEHIKTAATRQVKELQKLVDAGRMDEARAMASKLEAAGVLKKSKMGTPLKRLGAGREGIADLVLGAADAPKGHEFAVRKAYDPKASMFNPKLPDRKVQIGRELLSDPNYAQMFTPDRAHMAGNVPYHIGEFVPGRALKDVDYMGQISAAGKIRAAKGRGDVVAEKVLGRGGELADIVGHGDNVRVTPQGVPKIIDHMPFAQSEQPHIYDTRTQAIHRKFPNFTPEHMAQEQEMVGHLYGGRRPQAEAIAEKLNAQNANVIEGYKQMGGSRQARKVRGAKLPVATDPGLRPSLFPSRASSVAARPSLAPTMAPSLRPTMAPSLRARFSNLSTAGKAGVVGGAALGAGLLGYGAYRMMQNRPDGADNT
jgi:hypothetical protein